MKTNNNTAYNHNSNMIKTDTDTDQPTILHVVQDHVNTTPEFEVYNWYDAKGRRTDHYTYATIWEKSGRVAKALMDHPDIQQGDRVMICFPFGHNFEKKTFVGPSCPSTGFRDDGSVF